MHKNKRKEKLKTNNKKKKIIVTTVTTAVVFITVGTGVYINHLIKVKNYLSDLTYDIVQESYDTYGDYSKSKYQDIVPENIFSISFSFHKLSFYHGGSSKSDTRQTLSSSNFQYTVGEVSPPEL